MTELEGYVEITQGEYRRFKQNDPKNVNGYTARIGFKHFKKKRQDKIISDEFSDLSFTILENGWVLGKIEGGESFALGNYPNARFRIIERLMEEVKKC